MMVWYAQSQYGAPDICEKTFNVFLLTISRIATDNILSSVEV